MSPFVNKRDIQALVPSFQCDLVNYEGDIGPCCWLGEIAVESNFGSKWSEGLESKAQWLFNVSKNEGGPE